MRVVRWLSLGLLFALTVASLPGAANAFSVTLDATPETLKAMKIEGTNDAVNYEDHAQVFLRLIPVKGNRVFPAFINTHNYLTCPDKKDKKYLLYQISEAELFKRKGIRLLSFFFEKPECDEPTYHMEAIVADS